MKRGKNMFKITSAFEFRKYQYDALQRAKENENCIICLPTGTGKTLVGLMYACYLLNEKNVQRILILEPTRFLVNQIANYYKKNSNIPTEMIYGVIPKEKRVNLWNKGKIIVTTPQTAFNDKEYLNFDAIIVDECHHTTGEHAYAKLMREYDFRYKLGLSATIPKNKEDEIKQYIGEIFSWPWSHPDVKKYVPEWYGEVYDSEFDNHYKAVYEKIMKIRKSLEGTPLVGLCSIAIRMLCRDGAIALKETLEKENKISALLKEEIYDDLLKCGEMHKLEQMEKIINQHDFDKAIVFVDRVILARRLFEKFSELNPVLLLGRIHSSEDAQKKAVRDAADKKVKLVISTSAGEEGIDLPSADLLIVWSNTVSVVRFIQRTGRIMRKSKDFPDKLKIATYIATPDTPDYDALWHGLCAAANAGVEVPGIEIESLSKGLVIERVNYFLQSNPTSIRDIANALNIEIERANKWLKENVNRGKIFYFYLFPYDPIRKAKAIRNFMNGIFDEYLLPELMAYNEKILGGVFNKKFEDIDELKRWVESGPKHDMIEFFTNFVLNRFTVNDRIYALEEDVTLILSDYSDYFKVPPDFRFKVSYGFSSKNRSEYYAYGTSDEIFEKIKDQVLAYARAGRKVFLHFSAWGIYSGANIRYDGLYSEDTLKLIVKNAGWICWNIRKMNEIISGKND